MSYYAKAITCFVALAVMVAARLGLDLTKEAPLITELATLVLVPLLVYLVPNTPKTEAQVSAEAAKVSEADAELHSQKDSG